MESPGLGGQWPRTDTKLKGKKLMAPTQETTAVISEDSKSYLSSLLIKKRCLSGKAFFGNRANTHLLLVQEHRAASSGHLRGCRGHTDTSFAAAKPPQACPRYHQVWRDTSSSVSGRSLSSGCPKAALRWALHSCSSSFSLRRPAPKESWRGDLWGSGAGEAKYLLSEGALEAKHTDEVNFQAWNFPVLP